MTVLLACTWQPRGELNRLKRLYPQIVTLYDGFVLAVSSKGIDEVAHSLSTLQIPYTTYTDYSGRHAVLSKASEFEFDYLHYADFDRLLHWLETRPQEVEEVLNRIQGADCTVLGRTDSAFATHPQSMIQTEKLFNEVFSHWLGRPMDFGAGSRGFSKRAVETILTNCENTESLQMDVGWTILLRQVGLTVDYIAVDGLDWETPDQFKDTVADEALRQQFVQDADTNPHNWALRVKVAQKIIESGLAMLSREIIKEEYSHMTQDIQTQSGLDSIADMFSRTEAENRPAFLPYYPIGFPNYAESINAIVAMSEVGVDGFEIGMSFSDPLADGPTIQAATQIALENGMTVRKTLDGVRELRARGVHQPMLMMGYLNPLIAYGTERFVLDAKEAGADGIIVPDLPPEEAPYFADICEREQMGFVFLLAPTSTPERIRRVAEKARGFIYAVSLTGITGERNVLSADLPEFISRVRTETDKPLVLGFGISTPEHAKMMKGLVNGFIVGSALVKAGKEGVNAVRTLAKSLRDALNE